MAADGFAAASFAVVAGFAALIAAMTAAGAAPRSRMSLRFAAALAGALAAVDLAAAMGGEGARIAAAVGLLVSALVPPVLALAVQGQHGRPPATGPSAVALTLCCLLGLAAAATGAVLFAFTPLLLSAAALLVAAGRQWAGARRTAALLGLSSLCLVAAAAAFMRGAETERTGFALFLAAGILGVTLALARRSDLPLETAAQRGARGPFFIGGED